MLSVIREIGVDNVSMPDGILHQHQILRWTSSRNMRHMLIKPSEQQQLEQCE